MRDEMAVSLCCADCMGDVAIMQLEIDLRSGAKIEIPADVRYVET
jgi:hypothetical protein